MTQTFIFTGQTTSKKARKRVDIEWSAGSEGVRQQVYWAEDGRSLSIILTSEGIIIDVIDAEGEVIGTEASTYEDILYGLTPEE